VPWRPAAPALPPPQVNPRHLEFMNTGRVDAYNAGIRTAWKAYATGALDQGVLPARLVNAHHVGSMARSTLPLPPPPLPLPPPSSSCCLQTATVLLKDIGPNLTHDGVHLRHEFGQLESRIVLSTVFSALVAAESGC
jgi:hypothetical protein